AGNDASVAASPYVEDFETSGAIPPGWTRQVLIGTGADQMAESNACAVGADTPPNCLAAFPSSKEVDAVVVSTPISIVNPSAQIRFKNYYSTEAGYDGAVLEVKIGSGVFEDVIAAGGTFVSGGYSGVIDGRATSSIAGRSAWTGSSGGNYVLTVISL